jgi:hypothetical protein
MPRLARPRLLEMDVVVHTDAQKVPIGKRAAALRWRTSHRLGIPREPFKVYQRPVSTPLPRHSVPFLSTSVSLSGPKIIEWGRVPLMEAVVEAAPNTGQTLTFQALDDRGEPIPGEVASVTRASGSTLPMVATLRSPNICSILANGHGAVLKVSGSTMGDVVNDGAWTLLENVGLPFATNVTPATVYDSRPVQGLAPFGKTGIQAATDRLNVAKSIYIGPSGFVSGGGSAPTWTEPSTAQILSVITSGTTSLLEQIRQMLADTAASGTRQAAYRRS